RPRARPASSGSGAAPSRRPTSCDSSPRGPRRATCSRSRWRSRSWVPIPMRASSRRSASASGSATSWAPASSTGATGRSRSSPRAPRATTSGGCARPSTAPAGRPPPASRRTSSAARARRCATASRASPTRASIARSRTPAARLGLLAFRHGQPLPVPFQVDERRGRKLALPGGPEPTADDKPGVLDADDLLVFMACDAGEQASAAQLARALEQAGAGAVWRELRIEDPVDHARGFVYLVSAEHPPATEHRYVAYVPAGDLVESARYRLGLVNALPTYFVLATGATLGPNLIDGLRLRAEATLRADL